jgi:hypothetical protein
VIRYWEYPFGSYLDGGRQLVRRILRGVDAILNRDQVECDEVRQAAGMAGGSTFLEIMRAKVASEAGSADGAAELFGRHQLVGNLVTVFLAGADTTATALSWMCYHLAKDQVRHAVTSLHPTPPHPIPAMHSHSLALPKPGSPSRVRSRGVILRPGRGNRARADVQTANPPFALLGG